MSKLLELEVGLAAMQSPDIVSRLARATALCGSLVSEKADPAGKMDQVKVLILGRMFLHKGKLHPGDLRKKGIYFGSNPSYNIKVLIDDGYIKHWKAEKDDLRRSWIELTPAGREIGERAARALEYLGKHLDKLFPAEAFNELKGFTVDTVHPSFGLAPRTKQKSSAHAQPRA